MMFRKFHIVVLLFFVLSNINAQEETIKGTALFWTSQEWNCDMIKISIFNANDSSEIDHQYLDKTYKGTTIPTCSEQNALAIHNLTADNYFFIADCSKEQCSICNGEGSYWQATVQSQTEKSKGTKNQGAIAGTYKTCHACEGDGAASRILWVDTFSININQCRTLLLK